MKALAFCLGLILSINQYSIVNSVSLQNNYSSNEISFGKPLQVCQTVLPIEISSELKISKIKGITFKTDEHGFDMKWCPIDNVDGYELTIKSMNRSNTETHIIKGNSNTIHIDGRMPDESMKVYVKAYIVNKGIIEYLAVSDTLNIKTTHTKALIPITNIYQLSGNALPTGCECTSLSMALRFLGYDVTKNQLAEKYLEKQSFYSKNGKLIGADPNKAFVGSPDNDNSYGCYSIPLAAAANKYLNEMGDIHKAKTVDGKSLSALYKYIDNGTPVVIWATADMQKTRLTDKWFTEDGKHIQWRKNEHCLLLVGYDKKLSKVYCCDPLNDSDNISAFDMNLFEKRYAEQGKHAVVITKS